MVSSVSTKMYVLIHRYQVAGFSFHTTINWAFAPASSESPSTSRAACLRRGASTRKHVEARAPTTPLESPDASFAPAGVPLATVLGRRSPAPRGRSPGARACGRPPIRGRMCPSRAARPRHSGVPMDLHFR